MVPNFDPNAIPSTDFHEYSDDGHDKGMFTDPHASGECADLQTGQTERRQSSSTFTRETAQFLTFTIWRFSRISNYCMFHTVLIQWSFQYTYATKIGEGY